MADAEALGLDPRPLERLVETVEAHIAEGRYPGAEIAIARHGRLALSPALRPGAARPAAGCGGRHALAAVLQHQGDYRVAAVWKLVADGRLRFTDPVAMHLPGFEAHGKGRQSVLELLTHQGGFPNSDMPAGCLGGPRGQAARRHRLRGGMDARKPRPLPRRGRALDGSGADRSGFRAGFPRLHPRRDHGAARAGE